MASETKREQYPEQPAQQEQQLPTSSRNEDSGNAAAAGHGDAHGLKPAEANGAAQLSVSGETERAPLFPEDDNVFIPSDNNAGPTSDEVASPSISSPPYWTHTRAHTQDQLQSSNPRHTRAVSNASTESVLLPGAITLQDNECDDGDGDYGGRRSSSSELYGRDRNRACWARSVQVTDYVMVNGSTTNIGAFVVWNIRVETLNGSHMNIRKRYSEFDDLRKRLIQTFPNFEAAVPALPPKSVLKRFHPRFLEKRRAGLQYFLNCILLNPEFSGSPVLKEFLFS
ncbi:hypothetical protein VTK56DRAFT_625 [Thermocarpiscus australiensis]